MLSTAIMRPSPSRRRAVHAAVRRAPFAGHRRAKPAISVSSPPETGTPSQGLFVTSWSLPAFAVEHGPAPVPRSQCVRAGAPCITSLPLLPEKKSSPRELAGQRCRCLAAINVDAHPREAVRDGGSRRASPPKRPSRRPTGFGEKRAFTSPSLTTWLQGPSGRQAARSARDPRGRLEAAGGVREPERLRGKAPPTTTNDGSGVGAPRRRGE